MRSGNAQADLESVSSRADFQCPVVVSVRRPKPSKVFETYWRFAAERQNMFYRRLNGIDPLTQDATLNAFRFTNVFRASDRVSQYLINVVIPKSQASSVDTFFRVILFKTFNRISTWELLEERLGPLHWPEADLAACDRVLTDAKRSGIRIYSAAYIMPDPPLGGLSKHSDHLQLLAMMMGDRAPERVAEAQTMEDAYKTLLRYPSIGPFLAYQYVVDLNYSNLTHFSEMDFVVAGPGAVDGIIKCFPDTADMPTSELIRYTAHVAEEWAGQLGVQVPSLWGRPPQLIDYQNLFCEVGKYARVEHPEVRGRTGRARIKQRYRCDSTPIAWGYPTEWRLPLATASVDSMTVAYPGVGGT